MSSTWKIERWDVNMKVDLEIVTGFLGAGKTSFINALIRNTIAEDEKVIVILCERGERKIEENILRDRRVIVKEHDPLKPLTKDYLKYIIGLNAPHRIIVEYNGTRPLEELFPEIGTKEFSKMAKVSTVFHIADGQTFHVFINNMASIIKPYIYNSNMVVVNNTDQIPEELLEDIKKEIKIINPGTYVIPIKSTEDMGIRLKMERILDDGLVKKFRVRMRNLIGK
jgi:G3E family GTPase